jgi:hypothetical protein
MPADPPRYRIVDIGILDGDPADPFLESRALGVNNLGQVVGQCNLPIDICDCSHAVLWLPSAAFSGLAPLTLIDLTDLAGNSLGGVAEDINVHGQVIGSQSYSGPPMLQAQVWDLGAYPSTGWAYPLGTLCDPGEGSCDQASSHGFGINNDSPAVVV